MSYMQIILVVIIVGSTLKLIENMRSFVVDNEILLRFSGFSMLWIIPASIVQMLIIYLTLADENNMDYRIKGVILGILIWDIVVSLYYEKTITYKGIIINTKLYKWKEIKFYSYDKYNSNIILIKTKKDDEVELKLKESNIKDVEKLLKKKIQKKEISNQI
ncbi:MAG: DUF5673 domain-containing protein [Tepidibacter sp.]|uniref:DUF5673 domain-containing protein n=1 Tax=Tepidibacter sp. TaxID=2529387 RepID=UPI0025EE46FC|nr:DUF5673 domain-containing protein [Tepidibacter sp.]MCT4509579.1 DUF5673 domain-containing protein [Tepidibacter sp.]